MTNAIKKFQDDVSKLRSARATEKKADAGLNKAQGALGKDKKELKHDSDVFVTQHKTMLKDRPPVTALRTKMDGFETQQAQLEQELAANPSDLNARAQLASVEQKEATLQPQLDAATATLKSATSQVSDRRAQIVSDKDFEKHDSAAVKKDTPVAARARTRAQNDRHTALRDLTPAEYKMGLKQTNAARAELGLGKVKHVVRPGQISAQGQAQMKKLEQIAKGYAQGKRPEGWCLKKVEDYLQTTSYGKIGHGNIPRFPYAHDFADYLNQGQRYKSLGLQKLNIDNPYKAPEGSIIVVRAGTPGTANPVAGDIVVKGPGDHFYNDGEMGYGGSGNFPKGNSYVLGIYAPK